MTRLPTTVAQHEASTRYIAASLAVGRPGPCSGSYSLGTASTCSSWRNTTTSCATFEATRCTRRRWRSWRNSTWLISCCAGRTRRGRCCVYRPPGRPAPGRLPPFENALPLSNVHAPMGLPRLPRQRGAALSRLSAAHGCRGAGTGHGGRHRARPRLSGARRMAHGAGDPDGGRRWALVAGATASGAVPDRDLAADGRALVPALPPAGRSRGGPPPRWRRTGPHLHRSFRLLADRLCHS